MNKRLISLVVFLAIVTIVLILNFTLFTVKEVSVSFEGEAGNLSAEQIMQTAAIKPNNNIFTVSEQKVVERIQISLPSVKVISVERQFPNKIVIHCTYRYPLMALPVQNTDKYAIIDREFSVIEVLSTADLAKKITKGELLDIVRTNVAVSADNAIAGIDLLESKATDVILLQNAVVAFEKLDLVNGGFVSFADSLSYSAGILEVKTAAGVKMVFSEPNILSTRIKEAYSWFLRATVSEPERTTSGVIRYDNTQQTYVWNMD